VDKDELITLYSYLIQQQSQILLLTQKVEALVKCLTDKDTTIQTSYKSDLQEIRKQQRDASAVHQANSGLGPLLRELQSKLAKLTNPEE